MPAVGVFKREIARTLLGDVERVIDWFVTGVGVVALLVGSVTALSPCHC